MPNPTAASTPAAVALVYAYLKEEHPEVAALLKTAVGTIDRKARKSVYGEDVSLSDVIQTSAAAHEEAKPKKKQNSPKHAPVKESDSDEEIVMVSAKAAAVVAPAKRQRDEENNEEEEQKGNGNGQSYGANRNSANEGYGGRGNNYKSKTPVNGTVQNRFQRIDPTKVVFSHDALRDNRPGSESMVLRQNQEMMRVKGKQFNKLKQKNKGKLYAQKVDLEVRAFQFEDSD